MISISRTYLPFFAAVPRRRSTNRQRADGSELVPSSERLRRI
jgi:hypothetical protein